MSATPINVAKGRRNELQQLKKLKEHIERMQALYEEQCQEFADSQRRGIALVVPHEGPSRQ